jgi:hypothetical protein
MNLQERILHALTDPTLAYLLLTLGVYRRGSRAVTHAGGTDGRS